jgi:hypothetical protein
MIPTTIIISISVKPAFSCFMILDPCWESIVDAHVCVLPEWDMASRMPGTADAR